MPRVLVLGLVLLFWQTSPGAGQDSAARSASSHFRRGVELFQESAYRAALVEFNRAYEIQPDYRLLYNIAQVKVQLVDYLGAVQSFEAYLAQGGAAIPEARRADVATQLSSLKERVGRLSITVNRDGVEVFVDETSVGSSPLPAPVPVNVGGHRVHARNTSGQQASVTVDVAGGDVEPVQLTFEEESLVEAPGAVAPVAPLEPAERSLSTKKKYAIVCASLGGAAVVGAVFTGLAARSKFDDLEAELDRRPSRAGTVSDLRQSTKLYSRTTDGLAAAGIAALGAAVTLWLLDDEGSTEVSAGLGSVHVQGRF